MQYASLALALGDGSLPIQNQSSLKQDLDNFSLSRAGLRK